MPTFIPEFNMELRPMGRHLPPTMKTVQTQQNSALKYCITKTLVHPLRPSIKILTFYW